MLEADEKQKSRDDIRETRIGFRAENVPIQNIDYKTIRLTKLGD